MWKEELGNTEICLGGFLPLIMTALWPLCCVYIVASVEFSIQSVQLKYNYVWVLAIARKTINGNIVYDNDFHYDSFRIVVREYFIHAKATLKVSTLKSRNVTLITWYLKPYRMYWIQINTPHPARPFRPKNVSNQWKCCYRTTRKLSMHNDDALAINKFTGKTFHLIRLKIANCKLLRTSWNCVETLCLWIFFRKIY